MNIQKKLAATLTAALLCSSPLYAADAEVLYTADASTPDSSVQMVSGGIADSGVDAITATQNNYSLKLIFAEANGEYLADVGVVIRDHHKNVVVNATSGGPIALINLKPGNYTLVSTVSGESKTQNIVVNNHGLHTYYIHLHSTES